MRKELRKIENTSPFCGVVNILFWTSGDVSSGFQSQSGQPLDGGVCITHSLRFTSFETPTDLLVACSSGVLAPSAPVISKMKIKSNKNVFQ